MSSEKDSAEHADDFFVRLFGRGKTQSFKFSRPDNDPMVHIFSTLAGSILKQAKSATNPEWVARAQFDRVLIRAVPPAGIEALTIWIAPRHGRLC